jgi:two-component system sensor histidine kinase UhpB
VLSLAPESERAARVIADESSHLYDAMHGLIPRLTPLVLDNFGLDEALHDLVERVRRSQPEVRIELELDLGDAPPSSDVSLTLYRAAQEGITNALRHGEAHSLQLRVRHDEGGMTLDLTDDGRGLAPDWSQRSGHYGLRWLGERVEASGGWLSVEPHAPHGVRLCVRVPLQLAAETA